MKLNRKLLAAAVLMVVLAGCATSVPAPQGVTLINAERLNTLIEVAPMQTRATETGTLRAWINIRNRTKNRVLLEGRATFTGAGGHPLESASTWQRLFMESESGGAMQFLSMLTTARQVKIELREGNQ